MLSFFKQFSNKVDFSVLETDMHSHLVPGIDDGAKTVDKSVAYIKELKNLGFKKIITTPHIMGEHYPNTPEIIQRGLAKLKNALTEVEIEIEISAAAEYFVDDYFVDLLNQEKPLLTLPDNHLLIEFSTFAPPSNFQEVLFRLNTLGYKPILAHPERYVYYAEKFNFFHETKAKGCALQVNLLSLIGHYGGLQKKLAHRLMKEKLIDFAGTDLHNGGHIEVLKKLIQNRQMQSYLRNYPFLNNKF